MKYLVSLFLFLFLIQLSQAQVFLQLERYNKPNSLRFAEGQTLHFTLKATPDVWRIETINRIYYEQNLVVLDEGYRYIDEFDKLRLYRKWPKTLGNSMMQFAGAWYLYGGIASAASSTYNMSEGEIIIGAAFAAVGFGIRQLFHKKTIRLGKRNRLRIVDLRLFDPAYEPGR